MHFLALVLAATVVTAPVPSPSPAPQPTLKVIGSVRSTPFCTALHEIIGPAIASVLANDDLIASSKPAFATLYHDGILAGSEARAHFDLYRLEKLETPIIANVKRVDALLDRKPDDPKIQAMRAKLQAVAAQQKASLNLISGFVATEQLGEMQGAGPPAYWQSMFILGSAQSSQPAPISNLSPAAGNLFAAGVHNRNPGLRDPRYDARSVGPTYDPYAPIVTQIEQQRAAAQSAESDAAKLVADALQQCAP
jgi:hypothetical protein